jgi:hypothetical protein
MEPTPRDESPGSTRGNSPVKWTGAPTPNTRRECLVLRPKRRCTAMQRHVRSWITSRHGAYIVNVRLQPCQLIGCGPRSRPGGLAMFAAMRRARLNRLGSPLVRYSGGARQSHRLRLCCPLEPRCDLDAARPFTLSGAAFVVIDAKLGGPHAAPDILPQAKARSVRRSDFHWTPRRYPAGSILQLPVQSGGACR